MTYASLYIATKMQAQTIANFANELSAERNVDFNFDADELLHQYVGNTYAYNYGTVDERQVLIDACELAMDGDYPEYNRADDPDYEIPDSDVEYWDPFEDLDAADFPTVDDVAEHIRFQLQSGGDYHPDSIERWIEENAQAFFDNLHSDSQPEPERVMLQLDSTYRETVWNKPHFSLLPLPTRLEAVDEYSGLWAYYAGESYKVTVFMDSDDHNQYHLTFTKRNTNIPHERKVVHRQNLEQEMREWQHDLRKWRKCEYGE